MITNFSTVPDRAASALFAPQEDDRWNPSDLNTSIWKVCQLENPLKEGLGRRKLAYALVVVEV